MTKLTAALDNRPDAELIEMPRTAVIRTSDRISFKQCRRKWNWSSHLRDNLQPEQNASPLWLGSGIHYALEDYHGLRQYKTADQALLAYVYAYKETYPKRMPDEWREDAKLGVEMMKYYMLWLKGRPALKTYKHEGKLQLEVGIKIPIPIDLLTNPEGIRKLYDQVIYSVTLDGVAIDADGQLWIVEYKTAKQFATTHFMTDPQITTYCWAASLVYNKPVVGVIYQQHKKSTPAEPRILKDGSISIAQQATTHQQYRKALIDKYGKVLAAPKPNIQFLNQLARQESEDGDAWIRRDKVYRNKHFTQAEAQKILAEASDMLNPDLPLYPNPTRECISRCSFMSPCTSMDDGGDYKYELTQGFIGREDTYDGWRAELPEPKTFTGITI